MPETIDRVMAMVEEEIRANPSISNEELRARANALDESVGRMSARQFNATYPLQVKRRNQPRRARGAKKGAKKSGAKKGAKKAAAKAGNAGAKKRGRPAGSGAKKRGRPAGSGTKKRGRPPGSGAKKRGRPVGSGTKKRGRPPGSGTRVAAGGRGDATRGRVRAALLDFARDLASADGAGLVDVIAGVDGYVDRVMKATGQPR